MGHRPEDLAATLLSRARRAREQDEQRLARARAAALDVLRLWLKDGTIERAWLIGSAAWGGAHGGSDIDAVVEGTSAAAVGRLWDRISEACGMEVDLLRMEDLEPGFQERVLSEGVEVHGS